LQAQLWPHRQGASHWQLASQPQRSSLALGSQQARFWGWLGFGLFWLMVLPRLVGRSIAPSLMQTRARARHYRAPAQNVTYKPRRVRGKPSAAGVGLGHCG
jgi:hypothetical protein